METLEKIFGSKAKVRIMRLFLFNPQKAFDIDDVAERSKTKKTQARKEINNLIKIGLVKQRSFTKEFTNSRQIKKKRVSGWVLEENFPFLSPLQNFLIHIPDSQNKEILEKIKKVGSIKLVIISGIFIQDWDSRIDILIVGDKIKKSHIQSTMSEIESEIGKELKYTFFETPDFLYRLGVCDKLIRDILDYPHKKMINKLEIL